MNLKDCIHHLKTKYPENIRTVELLGVRFHLILDIGNDEITSIRAGAGAKENINTKTDPLVVNSVAIYEEGVRAAAPTRTRKAQSGRRSKPGQVKNSKVKRTPNKNYPSERTWQLAGLLMEKISANFPNIITDEVLPMKIEAGAQTIHKLTKSYEFKLIRDALLWAVQDPFWKKQVRSIARITECSKRNGNTKFENIAMAYQSSTKTELDELAEALENFVAIQYAQESEIVAEQVLEDIGWFQDTVEGICQSLPKQNRFYWHMDMKFLTIAKWLVELDFRIIQQKDIENFKGLMKRYLEFLQNRLQKNDIDTLHAGMFSDKSVLFKHFIGDLSAQWGSDILQES